MKKFCRPIILMLVLSFANSVTAQNEFSKWYFGLNAGLDFSTSPPIALTNGIGTGVEGCATICDSGGNLLFYAGSNNVINSNHTVMANGNSLYGHSSSTQSDIIVKQPGNTNIYYIFTTDVTGNSKGHCYSIVDMNLAAGLGSVTVLNSQLYTPTCEKQVAVRHCNGRDVWVVSHAYNSNEFRSYLLDQTGITGPIISAVGETITQPFGGSIATIGHMKISPDGKKLAVATASSSVPSTAGLGGFHLYDFDAGTGIVSNSLTLLSHTNINTGTGAYGVEFSPDGTKLYGTTSLMAGGSPTCALYQWDICLASNAAILASQYSVTVGNLGIGSVQRAIDNKLYIAVSGSQSISVINNPNASGAAMSLSLNAISLASKMSGIGLPNYINSYTRGTLSPLTSTIACQTVNFASPASRTFSSGCSSTPYNPTGYLWEFGEPGSGASNTSTISNPAHTYSALGSYNVKLILYSPCSNDTLTQTVNITVPGPAVSVAGLFSVCKGDKRVYTASGGNSYLWSNTTTASTVALSPTVSTVYSVSGTANGCTTTKVFTVTVNECLGISSNAVNENFKVYPNPFKENLVIDALNDGNLILLDINGKQVLESAIKTGKNNVSTANLEAGIYTIRLLETTGVTHLRIVKVNNGQ